METINLTIPNMKSPHCQMMVTSTVNAVGGKINSIGPTRVEIELGEGLTREQVIQAIQSAGYNALSTTL